MYYFNFIMFNLNKRKRDCNQVNKLQIYSKFQVTQTTKKKPTIHKIENKQCIRNFYYFY